MTYFLMLLFVFWFWLRFANLCSKHRIWEITRVGWCGRVLFAALGTLFFHNIW